VGDQESWLVSALGNTGGVGGATHLSPTLDFSGTPAFEFLATAGVAARTEVVTVDGGLQDGLAGTSSMRASCGAHR